jgi:hypothetical protein
MTASLLDINAVAATRPTADMSPELVAAWYDRKAVMLREIADTAGSRSEHDTFEALADKAYQHALCLRGEAA